MNRLSQSVFRVFLVAAVALTLFASIHEPTPAAAQTIFNQQDQPIYLIASYYNAIALQDYGRAYNYWNGNIPGGESYQQFVQGFANVQTVQALARLPIAGGVAAGTTHAEVPVVVLTTLKTGGSQIFAGCFHTVHYNVPVGNATTPSPNWYLYSADLQPAMSVDFVQATDACMQAESFPTPGGMNSSYSPVDVISSYYDAIAAHDYSRAYQYWQNGAPNQTLAQFAQGFANTSNVGVVVALSFVMSGAAGSIYASTPVLITSTDQGVQQLYAGCFVTRKSDVPVGNATVPDPNWYLYSATIQPVSSLAVGLQQVWTMCPSI